MLAAYHEPSNLEKADLRAAAGSWSRRRILEQPPDLNRRSMVGWLVGWLVGVSQAVNAAQGQTGACLGTKTRCQDAASRWAFHAGRDAVSSWEDAVSSCTVGLPTSRCQDCGAARLRATARFNCTSVNDGIVDRLIKKVTEQCLTCITHVTLGRDTTARMPCVSISQAMRVMKLNCPWRLSVCHPPDVVKAYKAACHHVRPLSKSAVQVTLPSPLSKSRFQVRCPSRASKSAAQDSAIHG